MADREKLIELLGGDMCKGCYCEDCEHENNENACIEHIKSKMADHLIVNGVTFATDNNVGGKWIPVTERLPEEKDYYLCCVKSVLFPDITYVNILRFDKDGFMGGSIYTDDVTHWMPLPEPPKGE